MKIRSKQSKAEIVLCAELMASSSPWNELYFSEEQCLESLSDSGLDLYIVEFENKFVGFMATRATGMEGEPLLEYLCIKHEFRGHGFGTKLLTYLEEKLFPDADNIYLFVSDINPRAIQLYQRIGYEVVGKLPNYNLWGQTEYLYRKFKRPRQERFVPKGSLTKDQNEGYVNATFDLNIGYAQIPLPEILRNNVIEGTIAAISQTADYELSNARLQDNLEMLLKLPSRLKGEIRLTFSGSIALDCAFKAIRKHAQNQAVPKVGLTAILPEPSIDLWQLLLKESLSREHQQDVQIKAVKQRVISAKSRVDNLIEELETQFRLTPNRQLIVIIDSPSNPFGIVTSAEDLERLASACGNANAVLIVDHCFLFAGLHMPKILPNVFNISEKICDWIGIWDTGKSIDLAGDKGGFIVPGSARMAKVIDETLEVIQPNTHTALRSVEVFSRLLGSSHLQSYLEHIGDICRTNLKFLQENAHKSWKVNNPEAGTFACVFFEGTEIKSDKLRKIWLDSGVNTASGRSFYRSTAGEGAPFVRISLVRDEDYFKNAIRRL